MNQPHVVDHGSGVTSIRLELPFISPAYVYSYVIEGNNTVAVLDCGADVPESWSAFEGGLEQIGLSSTDIGIVIGSHMHPDHIGMANRVLDASGAAFVMHHELKKRAPFYDDWSVYQNLVHSLAQRHGASAADLDAMSATYDRPSWAPVSPPVTRPVGDGDLLELGGRDLEVFYTPGHDRTHICLIDSATGHVFSGDHILPRITPHIGYDPDVDALGDYLESLERYAQLDPPLTYPAHVATPLERGGPRARQIALHHERRLETIVDALNDGPMGAWPMMKQIFAPHLTPFEQRLAFSETITHLDLLENRGQIELVTVGVQQEYRRLRRARDTAS